MQSNLFVSLYAVVAIDTWFIYQNSDTNHNAIFNFISKVVKKNTAKKS